MTEEEEFLSQLAIETTFTLPAIKEARKQTKLSRDEFDSFINLCSRLGVHPLGFIEDAEEIKFIISRLDA